VKRPEAIPFISDKFKIPNAVIYQWCLQNYLVI
jgi:hypothetical protein